MITKNNKQKNSTKAEQNEAVGLMGWLYAILSKKKYLYDFSAFGKNIFVRFSIIEKSFKDATEKALSVSNYNKNDITYIELNSVKEIVNH
ncbi:MAG: hypothetical protein K9J16_08225 [Melioribacteraceae bacterium]|nr:hypothetical protein [Melioribacteraceae bacterium]MCF8353889.1 hypothetical protein [Melioribacteraceae bacterium]MCF8393122.1 hypothetical protein [Melioribacteraceae bacterium]MCF8419241.1 hypothetical protein [Melioribacteraceae bacterium]